MRENTFTNISVQASVPIFAALSAKNSCTATQSAFQASGLNSGKHLTGLTRLASLILATLLLAACGGGGSSGSSGGGGASSGIQVTNLKAIPGSGSLTLTWDNPNANISSFDIDVYNLATNGTNERVVAASQVNRTISSNPAVNTTAPLAKVRYTISSGLVDNSNYSVAVTVNLQGADAGRATSARGLSGRSYLPANGVRIGANADGDQYADSVDNCSAIKNDDQANTYGGADNMGDACGDIDSDTIVDADDNCVDVANTDQRDTIGNGIGDACDSTDDGDGIANDLDNCPFTANTNQEDGDGDNVGDICDVDADGDGLIELSTAAELNMMRNNLNGTGLDADNSDNDNTTGGDSDGCGGGMTASGTAITTCNGYEQMANIDLNDLSTVYPGPATWEPVGFCTGSTINTDCVADSFSGKFNGNNHNISNMHIRVTANSFGVGLFGVLSSGGEIRNVHVRGGSITHQVGVDLRFTGGLAGVVLNGVVNASSVYLSEINASERTTGGLIGNARDAKIISSAAVIGTLSSALNVGGLVGEMHQGTLISSSAAVVGKIINLGGFSGGLVGSFNSFPQEISTSYAVVGLITGGLGIGGLFGDGSASNDYVISHSYAMSRNLTSRASQVGGLAGNGEDAIINSSYAVSHSIAGTAVLGGLVGASANNNLAFPEAVIDSYWDTTILMPPDTRPLPTDRYGEGQPTSALQTPTTFTGIYSNWGDGYCNPDTGEFRTGNPGAGSGFVQAWDLGGSDEYPKLNCRPNYDPAELQQAIDRVLAGESPIQ